MLSYISLVFHTDISSVSTRWSDALIEALGIPH